MNGMCRSGTNFGMRNRVARVTGPDVPYPPASLEHRYLPSVERISTAVRKVVGY